MMYVDAGLTECQDRHPFQTSRAVLFVSGAFVGNVLTDLHSHDVIGAYQIKFGGSILICRKKRFKIE